MKRIGLVLILVALASLSSGLWWGDVARAIKCSP